MSGTYDSANAGSWTVSDLTGLTSSNGNYSIGALVVTGTGTIAPRQVTVTALGGSSTYGSSPLDPGLTANGLQNGESITVLTGLSNSFGITRDSDARSYALNVQGTLTNSNYVVQSTVNGTWVVNPAQVNVTANSGSSVYGATPTDPHLSATGLQNNQDISALTGLSNSFGITPFTNAGNQALSVAGALTNTNYVVQSVVSGNWQVTPGATLTYVADSNSMIYGSTVPGLSGTVTGFVNGETQTNATTGTLAFNTLATRASSIGTYDISGSGLAANNGNYVFVQAAANTNAFTVNRATLTITANDRSKIYGETLALGTTAFTQTGLVTDNGNGHSLAGVTLASAGAAAIATVGGPGPVYAITAAAATGSGRRTMPSSIRRADRAHRQPGASRGDGQQRLFDLRRGAGGSRPERGRRTRGYRQRLAERRGRRRSHRTVQQLWHHQAD